MIGDMELAGLSSSTQQCYLRAVLALQRHTAARPDRLTEEQVYQYVLCLRDEKGVSKGTFQPHWHGIKFFYFRTLEVDWALFTRKKVSQPRRQRLPQAIAWKDGRALIQAIRKPGYRLLPLPPALLRELRAYWPSHGNSHLLFPNRKGTAPFCEDSLRRAFKDARDRLGVGCRSC